MKTFLMALLVATTSLPLTALAANFKYKCFSYDGEKQIMVLALNAQKATADILGESWDEDNLGGRINPNYRPRGPASYVKYGYNLVVEKVLLTGGKQLRDGSIGGFARVEGEAEGGFYQYKFVCRR